jgi:hypothetical protein
MSEHSVSERSAAARLGVSATEVHRMVDGSHRLDLRRLEQALPEVTATFYALRAELLATREVAPRSVTLRHLNATALQGRLAEEIRAALVDDALDVEERKGVAQAALAAAEELRRLAADAMRAAE